MPSRAEAHPNDVECAFCGKVNPPHNADLKKIGTHLGDGGTLGANIMTDHYKKGTAQDHPLSGNGKYDIAQAHHLIATPAMKTGWEKICSSFGYDINSSENGVFLPSDMRVACELCIPLHRGSHSRIAPGEESPKYTDVVKDLISNIQKNLKNKNFYCTNETQIIDELNTISKDIWDDIKDFSMMLTYDGVDYHKDGLGCLGQISIPEKRSITKKRSLPAPCSRRHQVKITGNYFVERGESKSYP